MPRRRWLLLLTALPLLPFHLAERSAAVPTPKNAKVTEWPMFGGTPSRNMVNLTDPNIPSKWSVAEGKHENIRWKAQLGSRSYSQTIVAEGKIFRGTNNEYPRNPRDRKKPNFDNPDGDPLDKGVLMCFDARTGDFLWQYVSDKLPVGQVSDWPREGITCTPAVDKGRVYFVTNRCEVICADINGFLDGKNDGVKDEKYADKTDADVIWRYNLLLELKVFPHNMSHCSPLIVGDRIFVCTSNGVDEGHVNVPMPEAPSFIALDKNTGKLLWQSNLPGRDIMHGQWASPAYAEIKGVPQVIFPAGDGWLYALNPENGKLIWKFDGNPKDAIYELGGKGTKSDFINAPVVYKNRIFIGTGQDPEHFEGVGHFWCIDPAGKTGDISPELVTDASVFPPKTKPNPNSGAVWHYGGEEKRQFAIRDHVFGRTLSTACIVDDVIYLSELAGYLHCLDARTGKMYWMFDTRSAIWGSPMYADGKVYVPNEDGDVFVFRHDPKPESIDPAGAVAAQTDNKSAKLAYKNALKLVSQKYLLNKIEMEEPIRSAPTVAGGVLYIGTERSIYAIAAGK